MVSYVGVVDNETDSSRLLLHLFKAFWACESSKKMGNRSDIGMKFATLFMVILILGGAFMVEANYGDCKTDDDCTGIYPRCCDSVHDGFCCDPTFIPPDELNH
ncbi:hypothetical protein SUGI_1139620 [Cryptomeria japonica]|nr:hypothetical protein SUGI_1139620 [Cryptomeria japonica]